MKTDFHHVVMIIYDGIENSVFESQVLAPLLAELAADQTKEATIVSFERGKPNDTMLLKKFPVHDRLHLVIGQKLPFFSLMSLRPALWQLIKILKLLQGSELRARGPLAGWLLLRAVEKIAGRSAAKRVHVPAVLIQARGLAAEEHRYAAQYDEQLTLMKQIKNIIIQWRLFAVELATFGYQGWISKSQRFSIEAVSSALRTYLIETFGSDPALTVVSTRDITPPLEADKIKALRKQKRDELGIPQHARVFIYSGSFKPWQCAEETIEIAEKLLQQDKNSFFLVLTGDTEQFTNAAKNYTLPADRFKILCVPSSQLTEYLAAGDCGFLIRGEDIINWVSRPTKALEYQAAGLKIFHNDTVAYLTEKK